MKTSELIKVLQKIQATHGDAKIIISVKDAFGRHGYDASINIEAESTLWNGITTNRDTMETRLTAHLEESTHDKKRPKITFR